MNITNFLSHLLKYSVTLALSILVANNLRGEINTDFTPRDYSIVPGSPQVAAIMEKIEYPVDYFHGKPTINLPIYSIKCGKIEIPIYLSYSSGGIRVDQKISNAGLGWTLICGAAISHTVYGAPDAAVGTMHGLWHLNADEEEFRQRLIAKQTNYDPSDGTHYRDSLKWIAEKGARYYEGKTDVANDMFHLSGLGLSATFSLMKDGQIISSSESPVKITRFYQNNYRLDGGCDNYGFDVETNEGLKYNFSAQDRTKYEFSYGSPILEQSTDSIYYSSAWHISHVSDKSGNMVKYNYTPGKTYIVKNLGHATAIGYSNPTLSMQSPSSVSGVNCVKYFTQVVESIVGSGITVKFHYLYPETSKSEAILKSVIISSHNNETRVFEFKYAGDLLSEVTDQNQTIYSFEYNLENGIEPSLNYYEQDFGGFPNGSGNNHLIPDISNSEVQIGWGSDRSVNPEYAAEASLRRITYATGGSTRFEWESNTFSHLNSVAYEEKINSTQTTSIIVDTIRACLEPGFEKLNISGWRIDQGQVAQLDMTQYFNMNPANLFGSAYHDTHFYDVYPERNPPHYPHIVVRRHDTHQIVNTYFLDENTIERDGKKEMTTLTLSPGTYDFELVNPYEVNGSESFIENEFRFHDGNCGYIFIRKISTDQLNFIGNQNWCGLRIKRIVSCAGNDETDILRKDFYYNFEGSPDATSGTVQLLPKYDYQYYKKFPCIGFPGYDGSEVYRAGETAFPQSPTSSFSNVEYPEVLVCMGSEDRMEPDSYLRYFSEIFTYSSSRNESFADYNRTSFLSYQPIGARMYTSKSHWRGNLLRKQFSPLVSTNYVDYSYNIYEDPDPAVLTTEAFTICDFTSASGDNHYGMYDYGIGTYSITPYNKTLGYEGVINEDGVKTYKRYDYFYNEYTDKLDWNLLKSLTECRSEFDNMVTHYTYLLGDGYYLPYPETEITTVGNEIVSAIRTEYDPVTYLPVRKYVLSNDTPVNTLLSNSQGTTASQMELINKLTYEYKYNSNGNLIEISYEGVPLASYIWGYNGLYPIIEATDTDYQTLKSAAISAGLSNDEINGRKIFSESKIKNISEALVKKLPHSSISSISYHWLFGLARISNPQGISSRFSYDPRGRLVEVHDFNNFLINKYEYHYGNIENR